jgi:hypothetical protein
MNFHDTHTDYNEHPRLDTRTVNIMVKGLGTLTVNIMVKGLGTHTVNIVVKGRHSNKLWET